MHALTEGPAQARQRLAAALRDDLRPLAERLPTGPAAEAAAPAAARATGRRAPAAPRDCLGHAGKAPATRGRLIDELTPPVAAAPNADAFLSQVRHNLKNPVGQIVGYAELLLEEEGGWKERHAA